MSKVVEVDEWGDPTMDALRLAWSYAIQCEGIPGAGSENMLALQALRDKKTTWFDADENSLRFALDNYLRIKGPRA